MRTVHTIPQASGGLGLALHTHGLPSTQPSSQHLLSHKGEQLEALIPSTPGVAQFVAGIIPGLSVTVGGAVAAL